MTTQTQTDPAARNTLLARPVRLALLLVGVVAVVATAPAHAEVRTGIGDRVADGEDAGSASVPALRSLRVTHDTGEASLVFDVSFDGPVASPSATSALRSTELMVWVGDAYSPPAACQTDEYALSTVVLPLGDDAAAPRLDLAPENPDFPRTKAGASPITGARAWNADRTVLTLRFADARLAGLTWICAGAASNRTNSAEGSYLRAFMLDGFTPYDGEVRATLSNLMFLDGITPRTPCRVSTPPDTWYCPSVTLNSFSAAKARGGRVRLAGTYGFETPGSTRYPTFRTFGRLTGTVSWRRCPRGLRATRRGRRCSIPVTWTGGDFTKTVQRAIARRQR